MVDGKMRGVLDKGITLATIGKKGNLYMSKTPPVLGRAILFSQQAPGRPSSRGSKSTRIPVR
jgi:hypothetical protein